VCSGGRGSPLATVTVLVGSIVVGIAMQHTIPSSLATGTLSTF